MLGAGSLQQRTLWVAQAALIAGIALLPFQRLTELPRIPGAVVSDACFATAVTGWLCSGRGGRYRGEIVLVGFFALAAVAATAVAGPTTAGWGLLAGQVLLLAVAVVTADLAADDAWRRRLVGVVLAGLAASLVLAVVGLALFVLDRPTVWIGSYGDFRPSPWFARVQAGMPHPNLLGSWGVLAAGGAVLSSPRRRVRLGWGAAAVALAASTVGRSVLAVLAVVGLGLAVGGRRPRASVAVGLAGVALGSAALGSAGRLSTMRSAWSTIARHPVTGVGIDRLVAVDGTGFPLRAHQTLLDMAGTLGLPAAVLVVLFVGVLLRHRPWPAASAALVVGVAIDSLTQDVNRFRHVWIALGLAAGLAVRQRESGALGPSADLRT